MKYYPAKNFFLKIATGIVILAVFILLESCKSNVRSPNSSTYSRSKIFAFEGEDKSNPLLNIKHDRLRILDRSSRSFVNEVDREIKNGVKRVEDGIILTRQDKIYLLKASRQALENYFSGSKRLGNVPKETYPNIIRSQKARVFITLINKGRTRGCQSSSGSGLLEDTIKATSRAIEDSRFGGCLRKEELKGTRIEITILFNPSSVKSRDIKEIEKEIEPGMYSLNISKGKKTAFFKNSVLISHSYSLETTLKKLGAKAKIGSWAYKDNEAVIYKYPTIQFAESFNNESLLEFYRYNKIIYQSQVAEKSVRSALKSCADYMLNHIDGDGMLTYKYDVYRGRKESPESSAGVIRCLASLWTLALLSGYFDEPEYREAAKRGLDYFLNKYYTDEAEKDFAYIKVGEEANIGTTAFALLTILAIDDDGYRSEERRKIINFILAAEDKEKGFLRPIYPSGERDNFWRKEIYYPGEALTALMFLYEKTKDKIYLQVAERVFGYYRDLFDKSERRASMVPWMAKVYSRVFFATGDKKYAEFVLKMNDYILKYQNIIGTEYVDKIGSFYTKGSACATGVYVEGLVEGYKVALKLNDKERIEKYRKAILMGIRFILQSQFREDNLVVADEPELALGGIRTTIYESSIRIDTVQHGASALLGELEWVY